jgi:hypothetical protein
MVDKVLYLSAGGSLEGEFGDGELLRVHIGADMVDSLDTCASLLPGAAGRHISNYAIDGSELVESGRLLRPTNEGAQRLV